MGQREPLHNEEEDCLLESQRPSLTSEDLDNLDATPKSRKRRRSPSTPPTLQNPSKSTSSPPISDAKTPSPSKRHVKSPSLRKLTPKSDTSSSINGTISPTMKAEGFDKTQNPSSEFNTQPNFEFGLDSAPDMDVDEKAESDAVNAEPDPFSWQDHEITGHLADDPADDGRGINGIGFQPTRAEAARRARNRRQQVAAWKSREAKEAREWRSRRREDQKWLGYGAIGGVDRVKVVRFE